MSNFIDKAVEEFREMRRLNAYPLAGQYEDAVEAFLKTKLQECVEEVYKIIESERELNRTGSHLKNCFEREAAMYACEHIKFNIRKTMGMRDENTNS